MAEATGRLAGLTEGGGPVCRLPRVPLSSKVSLYFRDVVEPLPGHGGHPSLSFETWRHLCHMKKRTPSRDPESLQGCAQSS